MVLEGGGGGGGGVSLVESGEKELELGWSGCSDFIRESWEGDVDDRVWRCGS